jgi:flagellar biosynthetic protein FliP
LKIALLGGWAMLGWLLLAWLLTAWPSAAVARASAAAVVASDTLAPVPTASPATAAADESMLLALTAAGTRPALEGAVRSALLLTLLSMLPAAVVAMTAFLRIVLVLAMVRHAFGMPETPPNVVLIGLALFLTAFTMLPTLEALNQEALAPFLADRIGLGEALERGSTPLREFMLRQTREDDLRLMYELSKRPIPDLPDEVSLVQLTPAFMLNELRVAFQISFVVMLPFLLIDLVVSSVMLALGMLMVPPATITLPLKVLLFVLIDGWALVVRGVVGSFH